MVHRLIVAVLSVIFAAVLFAADDVLLLNLQDKLENEVYGNASSLELRRDGTLSLDELDFLHDGVMLAVYNNDATLIAGLNPVQMPDTPFRSELLQTVTNAARPGMYSTCSCAPPGLKTASGCAAALH